MGIIEPYNAWKVSKHGPEITPYLDNFYAVIPCLLDIFFKLCWHHHKAKIKNDLKYIFAMWSHYGFPVTTLASAKNLTSFYVLIKISREKILPMLVNGWHDGIDWGTCLQRNKELSNFLVNFFRFLRYRIIIHLWRLLKKQNFRPPLPLFTNIQKYC